MVDQVLTSLIRDVQDFPKPGIVFKDITPILADPGAMNQVYDALVAPYRDAGVTKIVGIESRGFIFGTPMADRLDVGFVPVRKPGKLPWKTVSESYALEYGEDTLELHEDGVGEGDKVVVVDDLLATGGTLSAACRLVRRLGAEIVGASVVIELAFLEGRKKLEGTTVHSLLSY